MLIFHIIFLTSAQEKSILIDFLMSLQIIFSFFIFIIQ